MNNVNKVFHKILNKWSLFDLSIKDHSNNNVSVIQNHFWEVLSVSCNSRKELNMKIDKHFFMSFSFILIGLSISNSDIVELFELWEHVRDKPKHIRLLVDKSSKDTINIAREILSMLSTFSTVEVFDLLHVDEVGSLQRSNFNFIIVNSKENLLHFFTTFDRDKFLITGFFFTFTSNCSVIDDGRLFDLAWSRYIVNLNVVCQQQDKLWLETFQPFTNNVTCDKLTRISTPLSQINRITLISFPKSWKIFKVVQSN